MESGPDILVGGDVPRANPLVGEAIRVLNEHLVKFKSDPQLAWKNLGKAEREFIETEYRSCLTNPRYYLNNYHIVQAGFEGVKTLYPFWDSQEIFYQMFFEMYQAGVPIRIIVLKARQLGLSTISEGLIFWKTIFTPNCTTLIVAQDPSTADHQFNMSRLAYDSLPWWMRPERRYEAKGRYLHLDRKDDVERQMNPGLRSVILVEAANKMSGVARGKTIRAAHFCLSEKNLVITRDGYMKSIADVLPGEAIRCEKYLVTVKDVCSRSAEGENSYRITPWCNSAFPIEGTGNHRVLCAEVYRKHTGTTGIRNEQMKNLEDISTRDALVVPVRPILTDGCLPSTRPTEFRQHGGGSKAKPIYPKPNREWGFVVGLYLAEGTVDKKHVRVFLSLDKDEQNLADRWCSAVGIDEGKIIPASDGSRTRVHNIYNAELARWLTDNFGTTETKTIPDFCWWVGREFLEGVVEGLILGDGHANKANEIHLPSTRIQVAVGFREAVASLGFGYCGMYHRAAGYWYGRDCKELWTAVAMNDTNHALRDMLGLPQGQATMKIRGRHWFYSYDKERIYVRIRKIEQVDLEVVYDIEVDSQDHTYVLPACITHNSELASWENGGILAEQIFPTMHAPDELAIMESTAEGRRGFWWKFWCASVNGKTEWRPLFIPCYRRIHYQKPIPKDVEFNLTAEEQGVKAKIIRRDKYEISNEHFNWRRQKIQDFINLEGDEWKFFQEYPYGWMEAFQASGLCAFPKRKLAKIMDTTCSDPIWIGEVYLKLDAQPPKPRYEFIGYYPDRPDNNESRINMVEGRELIDAEEEGARLRIWEWPVEGESYYLGGDVALGNGGDFSCAQLFKIGHGGEPDEQVAEWHGWAGPTEFADFCAALGFAYNEAEIAIEVDGVGLATYLELSRQIEYPNLFRWKHYDKIKNPFSDLMGWVTNWKNRPLIISRMRQSIIQDTVILRSERLLDQMMDFGQKDEDDKIQGQETSDDRVMAALICNWCAHDSDYGKAAQAAPRLDKPGAKYYVFDELNRNVGQFDNKQQALASMFFINQAGHVQPKANWSMREAMTRRDFFNTDYSPIHDKAGIRANMYDAGVPAERISIDTMMDFGERMEPDDWRLYC